MSFGFSYFYPDLERNKIISSSCVSFGTLNYQIPSSCLNQVNAEASKSFYAWIKLNFMFLNCELHTAACQWKPVSYYSRQLFFIDCFRMYLEGKKFIVCSDGGSRKFSMITRHHIKKMQSYDFKLLHRPDNKCYW